MSTPLLYDGFGYPVSSSGSGRLYETTRPDSKRRPFWETRVEPIHRAVGYWDWKIIVSASRRLCANFPILDAAIEARATHSVGRAWTPIFKGADTEWGATARDWLVNEWFPICDVEGDCYDWKTSLFLRSYQIDCDGDFATILTQTEDGYPQVQTLASDRIGQRAASANLVGPDDALTWITDANGENSRQVRGAYKGCRIELGRIFTPAGQPVAIRVLGSTPQQDQDISLRDCIFKFDPKYRRQARGLPIFAGAIEFLASSFETHDAEARALMASSFLSLIEWNDSGTGGDTGRFKPVGSGELNHHKLAVETLEKGMVKYYRGGSGNKIEAHTSERPSDQWTGFQDRIIRIATSRIWPYSLCWKPDGMNGTQERSAIEQARGFVQDRQEVLRPVARREVGWAVSKAINLGILPPYRGQDKGGQLKWDFEMPPEFNIDHGREDQQLREGYKIGWKTLRQVLDRDGDATPVYDHWKARAYEEADKQRAISDVESERSIKIDARNIQMLGPNDQPQQIDPEEEPENPGKTRQAA